MISHQQPAFDDGQEVHDADLRAVQTLATLRAGLTVELSDAELRAQVTRLLAGSLQSGDHPIARGLLEREIDELGRVGQGGSETLYTLVAIVARYADPEDAPLIFRAREATPETRAGVDVEQMARAGVSSVRRAQQAVLREGGVGAEEASRALAWLDAGARSGAFDDLPGYFAWSDERFGLHVSGPT